MAFDRLSVIARLNIILLVVYLVLVLAAAFLIYQRERAATMRLVLEKSRSVAGEVIADMERVKIPFYESERSPETPAFHDVVRKQALINMIAMREKYLIEITSLLKRKSSFFPNDIETQQMGWFRKPNVQESDIITLEQGERVLLYMRPLRMTERCLQCHGNYDSAPEQVRGLFQRDDPIFDREPGELVGGVAVRVPMTHITAEAWQIIRHDITWRSLVFLIVLMITGLVIRKKIIEPLSSATEQFAAAAGVSNPSLPVINSDGTVPELARSLTMVLNKLQDKVAEQTEAEERFRRIVDLTPIPMITFKANGSIVHANRAAELWLGEPTSELRRRNLFTIAASGKDLADWTAEAIDSDATKIFRTVIRQEELTAPVEIHTSVLDIEKGIFLARLAESAVASEP